MDDEFDKCKNEKLHLMLFFNISIAITLYFVISYGLL